MGFHKWGYPINRWFLMENPNKKWMMWRYPYDLGNLHITLTLNEVATQPGLGTLPSLQR